MTCTGGPASSRTSWWDAAALRDPHAQPDKAARVRAIFDAIAPTYERVNSVMSLGRDAVWRRRAVAAANVRPQDVVLDIACGTGDMIRAFAAAEPAPAMIVGVDFAPNMLAHAACQARVPTRQDEHGRRTIRVHLLRADALRLPLADESVDVISCTFGVRNFQDVSAGVGEMHRVARRGGRVVILEFALPGNVWMRRLYRLYCEHVLPRVATFISRDKTGAYQYLPQSVRAFGPRATLARRLEQAGFCNVSTQTMTLGVVVLYRAEKLP